jgi:hypothetical protein
MLIGIAGRRQSGKTTLANLLSARHGLRHTSFAEPMREFVASILGITIAELEAAKELPVAWLDDTTPRWMLQTVGTEWGRRMVHPELWVRSALHRAGSAAVLSDVRFRNEAEAIRDRGGYVLRVHRPEELEIGAHASETPLDADLVDLEIDNSGTTNDMLIAAERFLLGSAFNPATDPDVLAYAAPGCPAQVMAGD